MTNGLKQIKEPKEFKKNSNRVSLKKQNLNVQSDSIVQLNAENLKRLRLAKAYTLDRLGELSGLSTSYISRLEASARRMNAQTLNRLARALECSPVNFFEKTSGKSDLIENGYKKNVPMYRTIPAGASVDNNLYFVIFLTEPIDYAFNLPQFIARESVFAIYALNDDYYPRFSAGSLLYFDTIEAAVKDFVMIIDQDNCLFMGELLKKTFEEVEIEVCSLNVSKKLTFNMQKVKQISVLLSVVFK